MAGTLTNAGKLLLLTPVKNAVTRIYPKGTSPSTNYLSYINRFDSTSDYIVAVWQDIVNAGYKLQSNLIGQVERRFTVTPANLGGGVNLTNVTQLEMKDSNDVLWFTGTFPNVFNFYSTGTLTINAVELQVQ